MSRPRQWSPPGWTPPRPPRTSSSRAGFLPTAVVNQLAQPAAAPRRPLRFPRGQAVVERFGRFNIGLGQSETAFAREVLRNEPSVVTREGQRLRIDTATISAAARTGTAARTIDGDTFTELLAGNQVRQVVHESSFALGAARQQQVVQQFRETALEFAAKQVRGGLVSAARGQALAGGLDGLRALVVDALDPRTTLLRAVNSRISALAGNEAQKFDDIMVAPELSEPTYGALGKISHDWLLPGIDQLPTDTTTW